MITPSRKIKFMNVNLILICTAVNLSKNLNKAIQLYGRKGYIMHAIRIDVEFGKMVNKLGKVEVKID